MKIYLAGRYDRRDEIRAYAEVLKTHNFDVTASWLWGPIRDNQAAAFQDVQDIQAADVFMLFTGGLEGLTDNLQEDLVWLLALGNSGGRHVEFGMALQLQKRVIIVGPKENVFHYLPQVDCYARFDDNLISSLALFVDSGIILPDSRKETT